MSSQRRYFLIGCVIGFAAVAAFGVGGKNPAKKRAQENKAAQRKITKMKIVKTDTEWKKILTEEQFHILREKGTERAFTGQYYDLKDKGVYLCAACKSELFSSEHKFDSGTGWPSFWAPAAADAVNEKSDNSFFMKRTEVVCSRCGGHLGHIFDDGPAPTGKRYCINSSALEFKKK